MKGRDLFGVVVRTMGLSICLYVVEVLIAGGASFVSLPIWVTASIGVFLFGAAEVIVGAAYRNEETANSI